MRARVCAAIIQGDKILMVKHRHDGKSYWTLPGGGVQPGESNEQALVREVLEETQLKVEVDRFLFEEPYSEGVSYCYLVTQKTADRARMGSDPEENDLPPQCHMLQGIEWHTLESKQEDQQVSKVLALI